MLLADFGIGREISSTSGLTATNMTVGTVSYAAPEQLMANRFMGAQTNMRWGPPPTTC
jgi:serine/threonine-protein kinase